MNRLRLVSAILLAIPLLVFGGNYYVKLFELPPGDGSPGALLLESMLDGGLMGPIALSHVVVGVLLLVTRTRFLGGLLQLPMSIGIAAFHATMLPSGLGLAILMLILNLVVIAEPARLRVLVRQKRRRRR